MQQKRLLIFLMIIVIPACQTISLGKAENESMIKNFQLIKKFILAKGDRQTYCNMYNNNPHYRFDELNVFLNPEPGGRYNHPQWNINCDISLSDFNELAIRTAGFEYFFKLDKNKNSLNLYHNNKKIINPENQGYNYFKRIMKYIRKMQQ